MKRLALLILISLAVFSIDSFSQIDKGKTELSLSGTFGSTKESVKSSYYNGSEESLSYLMLALRPGYFFTNSIELEPEIMITAVENEQPSFNFSGNISYNFKIKESNITPFLLVGYGIGNSLPILNELYYRSSDKLNITNLNLGAGLKIFVSKQVAIKTEYRYQYISFDEKTNYNPYYYDSFYNKSKIEYRINSHKLLVGFSFFF